MAHLNQDFLEGERENLDPFNLEGEREYLDQDFLESEKRLGRWRKDHEGRREREQREQPRYLFSRYYSYTEYTR